jgi:predicted nucleic acid-binding protein
MINLVVDTSVALKWYIPEDLTSNAVALLERAGQKKCQLSAPDVILPETANVIWKKHVKTEISLEEARFITRTVLETLPVTLYISKAYLLAAMEIAVVFQSTVYDSLYLLALAVAAG